VVLLSDGTEFSGIVHFPRLHKQVSFGERVPALECRVHGRFGSHGERLNSRVLGENKEYSLHLFIMSPPRGHLRKKPVGFLGRLVCVVPTLQHSKPVFHAHPGLYEVA
jgi:hypothetical protein